MAWCAAVLLSFTETGFVSGVVVLGGGDPNFNAFSVNPPAGPLRNSGGQFQGYFDGFAATPIGPHHFIAAGHIFRPSGTIFTFRGVDYVTLGNPVQVEATDLVVWRIDGTFPIWAPLFVGGGPLGPYNPAVPDPPGYETGRLLVAWGNGRKRGPAISNQTYQGWYWGDADFQLRWGVNVVADTPRIPADSQVSYVHATFDAGTGGLGDFECHLAEFDSSGAAFIREAGVWKLAGIHYSVDSYYLGAEGPDLITAFLFDARGLWDEIAGNRVPITGPLPVPSGFVSTRVSAYLPRILDIIGSPSAAITAFPQWQSACFTPEEIAANTEAAATADPEGDGLPNLAEYAFGAAPFAPSAEARPTASVVTSGGQQYAAVSYRRARGLTDVTCVVETSSDLQNWSSATGTTTLVSDAANGDTNLVVVRDNTPLSSSVPRRFLRVRVTRP